EAWLGLLYARHLKIRDLIVVLRRWNGPRRLRRLLLWRLTALSRRRRRGWLCSSLRNTLPRRSGAGAIENLLQFLTIELRRARCSNAILIGDVIRFWRLGQLLLVGREFEISELFLAHHVIRT